MKLFQHEGCLSSLTPEHSAMDNERYLDDIRSEAWPSCNRDSTVEDAALQAFTAMCEDVSGDWTKARDAIRKKEQLVRIIGQ